MGRTTIRLNDKEELLLKKIKLYLNTKTISETIRQVINNYEKETCNKTFSNEQNHFNRLESTVNELNDKAIENNKLSHLIIELLKQFYGEMSSYKEFDPDARNCEKVQKFLDDYYNPEDRFMK